MPELRFPTHHEYKTFSLPECIKSYSRIPSSNVLETSSTRNYTPSLTIWAFERMTTNIVGIFVPVFCESNKMKEKAKGIE